jgi:hypothetical protein
MSPSTPSIPSSPLRKTAGELKAFSNDLGGWLRGGMRRLNGAERRALVARFADWVQGPQGINDAELRDWITDLGEDGREALVEQLVAFCNDFELDLAWLVDGELADWPTLEAGLRQLTLHYCLACKAAVDQDALMQRFRRRRLWQQKQRRADAGSGVGTDPAAS